MKIFFWFWLLPLLWIIIFSFIFLNIAKAEGICDDRAYGICDAPTMVVPHEERFNLPVHTVKGINDNLNSGRSL
jgi:hypothetical protein